jgi:hypothetical protein
LDWSSGSAPRRGLGHSRSSVPAGIEKRSHFYFGNKRTHHQARPLFAGSLLAHWLLYRDRSREQAVKGLVLNSTNPCSSRGEVDARRISDTLQPRYVLLRDSHIDHVLE